MQTYAHDVSLFFNDAHNDVGQILIIFTHLGRARNHVLHTKNNGHIFLPPTHMTSQLNQALPILLLRCFHFK